MVGYGAFKISQTLLGVAKIAIRFSFSGYVPQFLRSIQKTFIAVYSCFNISQTFMSVAKISVRYSFSGVCHQILSQFPDYVHGRLMLFQNLPA